MFRDLPWPGWRPGRCRLSTVINAAWLAPQFCAMVPVLHFLSCVKCSLLVANGVPRLWSVSSVLTLGLCKCVIHADCLDGFYSDSTSLRSPAEFQKETLHNQKNQSPRRPPRRFVCRRFHSFRSLAVVIRERMVTTAAALAPRVHGPRRSRQGVATGPPRPCEEGHYWVPVTRLFVLKIWRRAVTSWASSKDSRGPDVPREGTCHLPPWRPQSPAAGPSPPTPSSCTVC